MHARILPAHQRVLALVALLLAPTIPWDSPYAPIPLRRRGDRLRVGPAQRDALRPPRAVIAAGLLFGQLMLTTAIVVDDRQHSVGLAILVWPLVAAGGALRLARRLGLHRLHHRLDAAARPWPSTAARVLHDPILLTLPLATVARRRADVGGHPRLRRPAPQRGDPRRLTGMLNRTALAARTHEIEHQSATTGHPVAVVVLADVDHFKAVNDGHGHGVGDHVLRDLAYVMRKQLRAFDLAYRVGGEEFAMIMPGADEPPPPSWPSGCAPPSPPSRSPACRSPCPSASRPPRRAPSTGTTPTRAPTPRCTGPSRTAATPSAARRIRRSRTRRSPLGGPVDRVEAGAQLRAALRVQRGDPGDLAAEVGAEVGDARAVLGLGAVARGVCGGSP